MAGKKVGGPYLPGGAYISCSDREGEPVALRFAAMALIASKQEAWKVDITKRIVCGFSAGAHNAAMYSVYWDTPLVTDQVRAGTDRLRPAAAILGYTLSDYVYKASGSGDLLETVTNNVFLGTDRPSHALLDEVSPARHVTENTPPMFIWATSEDDLVPVQHSLWMAHALADKKVPFELHVFEKGAHGLSIATQAAAVAKSQINRDVAQWTDLAEAWLEKRFALELPDLTDFEMGIMDKLF